MCAYGAQLYVTWAGGLSLLLPSRNELLFCGEEDAAVQCAYASETGVLFATHHRILWLEHGRRAVPVILASLDPAVRVTAVWGTPSDWAAGTEECVVRNGIRHETFGNDVLDLRGLPDGSVAWLDRDGVVSLGEGRRDIASARVLQGRNPIASITLEPNFFQLSN
jgi:hypothetical protein